MGDSSRSATVPFSYSGYEPALWAFPGIGWRIEAVAIKATGGLPDIGWRHLFSMMMITYLVDGRQRISLAAGHAFGLD